MTGTAQETNDDLPTNGPIFQATDEVPESAMQTELGRQLAARLRHLRRAESTMGQKHPSLRATQDEIAAVKERLAAWGPGAQQGFRTNDQILSNAVRSMNDADLRQLVFRMALKIEQLENRLRQVEEQLEVY
jgi:hypothetical protein